MDRFFSQENWQQVVDRVSEMVGVNLPNVVAAIVILVVGWLLALFIAMIVRWTLRKTGINRRLQQWAVTKPGQELPQVDRAVGKGVFYLLMLFVLVAFFQTLGLTLVTEPLNNFLNTVFEYAPRLVAAGILLLVAWVVARILRFLVEKALTAAKVDRRLVRQAGVEDEDVVPLTRTISETVYWLVFLLFLPTILDALAVPGLLGPVQDMLSQILGFLPNLLAAAVILAAGWLVARIIQRITTNLLAAVGADRLSERVQLHKVLGGTPLSDVLGLVVYVLVLIPVLVAALNALNLEAVTAPASQVLNTILSALPGIFAAVLVVAIAYVVGRIVAGLTTNVLAAIGFNRLPAHLGLGEVPADARRTPAEIAGTLVLVAIMLLAVMQALPLMEFDLAAALLADFLVFAGHVLLGLLIVAIGLWLARLVAEAIEDSGVAQSDLLSMAARVSIIVLAVAMGLRQMGVANEIIIVAFALVGGAIAVAAAIAFGIGGRDAAKRVIDDVYKARVKGEK